MLTWKMDLLQLAYFLFKETVTATMMLYKNTKPIVRSHDGGTAFFYVVPRFLQGGKLAPYLSVIRIDNVFQTSKDLKKKIVSH